MTTPTRTPAAAGRGVPSSGSAHPRLGLPKAARAVRTALVLEPDLSLDVWLSIGEHIHTIGSSSAWWAGDWLIHGRRVYPDRYRQAIARTLLDYQTLKNYAWVARKFAVSRRRENLSFHHHQEVAALPEDEQDVWLDRAAVGGWSKTELRRRIRAQRDEAPAPTTTVRQVLRFEVSEDRWAQWQEAANRADCDVTVWLTQIADRAVLDDPTDGG